MVGGWVGVYELGFITVLQGLNWARYLVPTYKWLEPRVHQVSMWHKILQYWAPC